MKLLFLLVFLVALEAPTGELNYPQLFISYSDVFDSQCSQRTGFKINPEWIRETLEREKDFQHAWDSEGQQLVQKLISQVGRGFKRKEMSVTLTVCNMVAMSNPFLINVKWFLKSYNNPAPPSPIIGFVDLTLHELIHNYLVESFDWQQSPLLYKYKDESPGVLCHLHLMSLQKRLYNELKRDDLLSWLDFFYGKIGGDYSRAWDLVNQSGNYLLFADEVKSLSTIKK